MNTREAIAEVLAAHAPACSGPRAAPRNGERCGPIFCVQCSEAAQEWVTWTPAHVAAAIAGLLGDGAALERVRGIRDELAARARGLYVPGVLPSDPRSGDIAHALTVALATEETR